MSLLIDAEALVNEYRPKLQSKGADHLVAECEFAHKLAELKCNGERIRECAKKLGMSETELHTLLRITKKFSLDEIRQYAQPDSGKGETSLTRHHLNLLSTVKDDGTRRALAEKARADGLSGKELRDAIPCRERSVDAKNKEASKTIKQIKKLINKAEEEVRKLRANGECGELDLKTFAKDARSARDDLDALAASWKRMAGHAPTSKSRSEDEDGPPTLAETEPGPGECHRERPDVRQFSKPTSRMVVQAAGDRALDGRSAG